MNTKEKRSINQTRLGMFMRISKKEIFKGLTLRYIRLRSYGASSDTQSDRDLNSLVTVTKNYSTLASFIKTYTYRSPIALSNSEQSKKVISPITQHSFKQSENLIPPIALSNSEQSEELYRRVNPIKTKQHRMKENAVLRISTMIYLLLCTHSFMNSYDGFEFRQEKKYVIMLDPAGDENYTGRVIENTFERGLTLQCVQALKQELEQKFPSCTVMVTRTPGQTGSHLQHATLANRMATDLYVSINFFQETGVKPSIFMYQFSYNDDQLPLTQGLAFYPFDQAHRIHAPQTRAFIGILTATLSPDTYKKIYEVKGVFKMPFAPLIGIIAPAIGLEVGLIHASDWQKLIEPLATAILTFRGSNA
jgi:N-acetylmuramoyl-L-alanine amidase